MITESLLRGGTAILTWVVGLLPVFAPPSWVTGTVGSIQSVLAQVGAVAYWVPLPLMITVAGTVLAVLAVGFGIKVARITISFFTAGGGSAG